VERIYITSFHHVLPPTSQAAASIARGHRSSGNGREEGQLPIQRVMDWIRTMAERLSTEEEDGMLCMREQMSRKSQLAATFPSLPVTRRVKKRHAWHLVSSLLTQRTPSMMRGGRSTCPMAWFNQPVTQGNKAEHPMGIMRSARQSRQFGLW
jgi:hypothetical protein